MLPRVSLGKSNSAPLLYIDVIAGRVRGFGGDPAQILPSETGQVPGQTPKKPHPGKKECEEFIGKIEGIIYDRFGDFAGFILDTDHGKRRFKAREPEIEQVVSRAWSERILTSVFVEHHDPQCINEIVLHCPPKPFRK
jgi:hypothetical protein